MPLLCESPPKRPPILQCSSISELLLHFEEMFLSEGGIIQSASGLKIQVLGDHFFHLVGINGLWSMPAERAEILATTDGMGKYEMGRNGSRARRLWQARETMLDPDVVSEHSPHAHDRWVFVKEYDDLPNAFTVALVKEREGDGTIIPGTTFPCRKTDIKRWLEGTRIYTKNTASHRIVAGA